MPRRQRWREPEPLPNENSPHNTPASVLIDAHYHTLQLTKRWTWFRYVRLCNLLKMTPYEMASLVMLSHKSIAVFEQFKVLPQAKARPVALVLTMLEAHILGEASHDVIKNPFPNLNAALQPKTPPDALPGSS